MLEQLNATTTLNVALVGVCLNKKTKTSSAGPNAESKSAAPDAMAVTCLRAALMMCLVSVDSDVDEVFELLLGSLMLVLMLRLVLMLKLFLMLRLY